MEWIFQLPVLFFSVIFHEFAHGYTAYRHGDDTAYLSGRLSLNPLPHIDPVGTVLIPAACALMHIPTIGWAKPVPVNPYRLHNPRADMAMVALSGPLSNLFLCGLAVIMFKIVSCGCVGASLTGTMLMVFASAIQINLLLAIFNLIPVFPLDGSQILLGVLKGRGLELYEKHIPYGSYIILVLVFSGGVSFLIMPLLRFILLVLGKLIS